MDEAAIMAVVMKLGAIAVLVLLNGFFVAAEFALVKVRSTQLDPLIEQGNNRARVAKRLVENLDASLSAAQLGITLASLGLGWYAEPIFAALMKPVLGWFQVESEQVRHSISFAVGFTLITFLHITAGEQAPKSLAIKKSLPTALWIALPLMWFQRVSYPFIWVLNHASLWILSKFGIEPAGEHEMAHSEEELRLMVSGSQHHGAGESLGRRIVLNAFDLRRRLVRDVMRPRHQITGLDTELTTEECLELAEQTRFSRFPLCEAGDLDRTIGVIHIKDLYAARRGGARTGRDLVRYARKLVYVPELAPLEKLLAMFLEKRLHFAMVVDEYGGTTGMVTLENVLEELVGQIQDEFDQEKPMKTAHEGGGWDLDGALPLHEFEELVGEPVRAEGVSTLSGWVTMKLGGFPREGNRLELARHVLRVEEMDGMRVTRLRLEARSGEASGKSE